MNCHVRKTKGVTSDHPVPVPYDAFLFDLEERHNGYKLLDLLDGVYTKVQTTMENELSGITIDQLVKSGIVESKS